MATEGDLTYGKDMWDQVGILQQVAQRNRSTLHSWKKFLEGFNSAFGAFEFHLF
jgi:hypothetical protein